MVTVNKGNKWVCIL